jgi:hypothetical protein
MVELVIGHGCICSKFATKFISGLKSEVGIAAGTRASPPSSSSEGSLFLLFLQEIISGRPFLARRNARFQVG